MEHPYWTELLADVVPGRVEKPRISGLTMVIDGGLSISDMRGLFELAAEHIDYWKLGYGSACVCPPERIQDKISLCQEYDVLAYPGGTSFEIAYSQGVWKEYLKALWETGIHAVEISDGIIQIPLEKRREVVQEARQLGFTVLTEVGKKTENTPMTLSNQLRVMRNDLNCGANYVIVEARESGQGIGIYDADGKVREPDVDFLTGGLGPLATRLFWEAPLRSQQVAHIRKFGHKVNLGNVHPWDVVSVESLRRGLRSDTMAVPASDAIQESAEDEDDHSLNQRQGQGPTLWGDAETKVRKKKQSG